MTTAPPITLADFLLARIGEDELAATLVSSAPPTWSMTTWPHDGERIPVEIAARTFNPARVLAECEAKRRIVEDYKREYWPDPGDIDDLSGAHAAVSPAWVLRCLALPYADHPDYREEWRP